MYAEWSSLRFKNHALTRYNISLEVDLLLVEVENLLTREAIIVAKHIESAIHILQYKFCGLIKYFQSSSQCDKF